MTEGATFEDLVKAHKLTELERRVCSYKVEALAAMVERLEVFKHKDTGEMWFMGVDSTGTPRQKLRPYHEDNQEEAAENFILSLLTLLDLIADLATATETEAIANVLAWRESVPAGSTPAQMLERLGVETVDAEEEQAHPMPPVAVIIMSNKDDLRLLGPMKLND